MLVRARRLVALAAIGALAATPFAAAPSWSADPAPSAATWMTSQLTNGLVHNSTFDFDDLGLSADFALGLDGIGGQAAGVSTIVNAIEPVANTWYMSSFGGVTTTYGGSLGKAAVLAQVANKDARNFGGDNLITRLEGVTADAAPIAGRVQNENDFFGDANTVGQSFAVRALKVAGSPESGAATAFLLKQQCAAGYFRLDPNPDKAAADQGCVDGSSPADPDATSQVVLNLLAMNSGDPAVVGAIIKATAWLKAQQRADGSFVGGSTTEVPNTNSTGLAAMVLASQGDCVAAGRAASWVRTLQVPATQTGPLSASVGAIAYDKEDYAAGVTSGITAAAEDKWRRATAQAAPALLESLSATIGTIAAPDGYVRAGSTQTITLDGVSAGESLCYRVDDGPLARLKVTASPMVHQVTLPKAAGETRYSFTAADGAKTITLASLAELRIKTAIRKQVRVGKRQVVRLSGLAAGESVQVKINARVIKKGFATADGTFKAKIRISKKFVAQYAKDKKNRVVVRGEFSNRRNVKRFAIIRPGGSS